MEKRHTANRKLVICETVFCGLATRSVHIVIQMPIQIIAFVTKRLSIEIVTEEHIKAGHLK
jgi:hypothetical protein